MLLFKPRIDSKCCNFCRIFSSLFGREKFTALVYVTKQRERLLQTQNRRATKTILLHYITIHKLLSVR